MKSIITTNVGMRIRSLVVISFVLSTFFTVVSAQQVTDPSQTDANYDTQKAQMIEVSHRNQRESIAPEGRTAIPSTPTNASNGPAQRNSSCWITRDGSFTPVPRNDDGSLGPLNIPFNFDLYGTSYNRVWINTNGNLTFTRSVSQYSASGFPFSIPMVAPFWGDVDTRNSSCGQIWYKITSTHMIVTWENVGFYSNDCSRQNTFQVVIGTYNDPLTGVGQNVCFHYLDMQWTTGRASGGVNGFGGTPATVGINSGNNSDYVQIGRFNQNNSNYDGPGGAADGVNYLDNQCFCFNVTSAGNIPPAAQGVPPGSSIDVVCGQTVNVPLTFLAPEVNQSVSVTVNTGGLCGVTSTISNGTTASVNLSITGQPCNQGTHTIVITATDNGSPAASTTVNLVVNVTACCPSTLSLTGAVSNVQCAGQNNGSINLSVGAGSAPYSYSWSNGATSQDISGLPAGTYSVTVTDANGCQDSRSFSVTQPSPLAVSASAIAASCPSANDGSASASVSGGTAPYAYAWSNGSTASTATGLAGGTYSVTVTDGNGCTASASVNVRATDATPPTANCQNVTVYLNSSGNATVSGAAIAGGSTDNCGPLSYSVNPSTFGCGNIGPNPVVVTVSDGSGNLAQCTANVTVADTISPTILCPSNISISNDPGQCCAVQNFSVPVGDNCPGGGAPLAVPGAVLAGTFNGHTYYVSTGIASWSQAKAAANASGGHLVTISNAAENAYVASLYPTQRIWIGFNDIAVEGTWVWETFEPVTYTNWAPGEPNNYLGAEDAAVMNWTGNGSGTWNDWFDNSGTLAAYVVEFDALPFGAVLQGGLPSGSCFPVGTTTNTYSVTDNAGNTSSCSFTITVTDNEAPTINCPANISVIAAGPNGTTVGYATPVGTDNCSASTTQAAGLPSGSVFPLGTTTNTFNVVDQAGNTASCSFNVTVTGVAPQIVCPANITVNNDAGNCSAVVSYQATDPVGIPASTISYSINPGSTFPVGTTTVSATATNVVGTDNCSFTVTVVDNEAPNAICQSVSLNIGSTGTQSITAQQVNNGSTDNCGIASYSLSQTTFDCSDLGNNTVNLSVTDIHGNVGTCTANVTVSNDPLATTTTVSSYNCGYGVSCNGASDGSASVAVTGGCEPYSYSWSNGGTSAAVSGLGAGSYGVTVTDANGNTTTASVTLTQPAPVTSTLVSPTFACGYNISCNGGNNGRATAANTAGGCAPYTFAWSNGGNTQVIRNLTAGTYSVTVTDANGCTYTDAITLTEPAPLTSSGVVSSFNCGYNVSCNGASDGEIDLSVAGGASCVAYTYAWSNGATSEDLTGVAAGTYSVTVTDANGCSTTNSFTLTEPAALTSSLTLSQFACGKNISCNGASDGSITQVVAGGCAPYTYLWSNGSTLQNVQGLSAGTFNVTITDANGCQIFKTAELLEPDPLVSTGVPAVYACGYNVSCNGAADGSIDLSATGGADCVPYAYQWSNGATTEDVSGLTAGTYSVTVTDVNGCSHRSSFTLTEPDPLVITGTVLGTYACGFNVSCNGANDGSATVSFTGGADCQVAVASTSGPVVTSNSGSSPITLSNLSAGTYTITVTDANSCSASTSVTLTQPDPLVIDAGPNKTVYFGYGPASCATLVSDGGDGGCAPYSIVWTDDNGNQVGTGVDITVCPQTTTTYFATITDANHCTYTDSAIVCVIDVTCNNGGNGNGNGTPRNQRIQICHYPPGNPNGARTMCLPIQSVPSHLAHGDHLGDCSFGPNPSCPLPAAKTAGNEGSGETTPAGEVAMDAYPNPFERQTTIRFSVTETQKVTMEIFTLQGEKIATLYNEVAEAGLEHKVEFRPETVTDGVYMARLITENGDVKVRRLVLMR